MDDVKRITQAYSQAPWRKQLQIAVFFMVIMVFCALVAGIYLNVSARSVTLGHEIQQMQERIDDAERTNEDLQTELAYLRSSSVMEERAHSLGFEPVAADHVFYFDVPGYVDRQTAVLAQPPSTTVVLPDTVSPAYTESLFDWLKNNVLDPAGIMIEGKP